MGRLRAASWDSVSFEVRLVEERNALSSSYTSTSITSEPVFAELETLIRRDPAMRGLRGGDHEQPLCPGELARASRHIAAEGAAVAIVTGFWVSHSEPAAVETDGPPGALFLARALNALGIRVWLLTDCHGVPALRAALRAAALSESMLVEFPFDDPARDAPTDGRDSDAGHLPGAQSLRDVGQWLDDFFRHGPGGQLTHLVAVERAGPSHTPASLNGQTRSGHVPLQAFLEAVPAGHQDQCHNMRGEIITASTAPMHRMFEFVGRQGLPVTTIGIGDGGNEIGMGTIPWEELQQRVVGGRGGLLACRIPTDYTIVAGTSNWGAYALAAGALRCRDETRLLEPWDRDEELRVLRALVEQGNAVDGITGRRETTVDGLPFETYVQTLEGIRRTVLG